VLKSIYLRKHWLRTALVLESIDFRKHWFKKALVYESIDLKKHWFKKDLGSYLETSRKSDIIAKDNPR
jgi:hypothetical protein